MPIAIMVYLICAVLLCVVPLVVMFGGTGRIRRLVKLGPVDDKRAVPMPRNYLKPERRKLIDVPFGETVHINFTDVSVDMKGSTFVALEAKV